MEGERLGTRTGTLSLGSGVNDHTDLSQSILPPAVLEVACSSARCHSPPRSLGWSHPTWLPPDSGSAWSVGSDVARPVSWEGFVVGSPLGGVKSWGLQVFAGAASGTSDISEARAAVSV